MAKSELELDLTKKENLEKEIKVLLIPKDPNDAKNAVVEIIAGTGGDEASIFCGDLFRMYNKYIESKKWKVELVDYTEGTSGGFKSILFNVIGDEAYGFLKYEGGVHRVQRVPKTETQGRVHTSASAVVVLPEAEDFDVELKDSEEQQYKQELRYLDESNQSSIYSETDEDELTYNESKIKNISDTFQSNRSSNNTKNRSKITKKEEPIDVEPLDEVSINKSQDSISNDKEFIDIEDPW